MRLLRESCTLASVLALSACAADLQPKPFIEIDAAVTPDAGGSDGGFEIVWVETGRFRYYIDEEGTYHAYVNATSYESWRFLDLDTGLSDEDPERWDLAFQRMAVDMNGGVSGEGGVEALVLEDIDFDDVSEAPLTGYSSPLPDSDDRDEYPDSVFTGDHDEPGNAWYLYEIGDHSLSPRPWTYVVKSTEGRAYKFAFDGYYDSAGSPANITFRFAEIPFAED